MRKIEKYSLLLTLLLLWFNIIGQATTTIPIIYTQYLQQTHSDSLIVKQLRTKGIQFSNNNSVTLLTTGQEKFDDLFKAIDQAHSSIHLEYFNFRNDSINNELITRLAKKAKEGIEVRAIFDGFGNASNNRPMRKRHLKEIRKKGIEIYEFKPMAFPWIQDIFNRDHRKIVVIDGKIGYTGGMNVADYYIKGTKAVGEWHDMHCRIEGDAVNTLQKIFLQMWNKVSGQNVHGAKYYRGISNANYIKGLKADTCKSAGHQMVGIINREPHVSKDIIRFFYEKAINDAKDSIKIINPYFTLSPKLRTALKNAAKRGVKVEIMLSVKSDIPLTPDCSYYNAQIILVDGKFCTIGSANLNSRSLRWDREVNAVVIDKGITKELDTIFENQKKKCFKLTEEKWNKWRTPWQKLKGKLGYFLSPFL